MGEVDYNFLGLVVMVILTPIALTWLALGFFMFLSEPTEHTKQFDLFEGEDHADK